MSSQLTSQEDLTPAEFDLMFRKARYGKYMSKTAAARRIQTRYRRYKQGQDQRDLGNVVRSHRKANPYQIQPSAGRTVTFMRKTQISIPLSQTQGFNAAGSNINWGFSLGRIIGYVNGAFVYAASVSSAAEFQALFDYYMIKSVKMTMFFTKNVDAVSSSGNTSGLPLFQICNDFDDIQEVMTTNSMNERVGVRHVQFDSGMQNGINHYVKPKPSSVVVQTNVDTGVLSTANAGVVFGTQWLDSAQSNIVHNGIKVVYDNQGVTTVQTLGTVTFIFDVEYVFKGYR